MTSIMKTFLRRHWRILAAPILITVGILLPDNPNGVGWIGTIICAVGGMFFGSWLADLIIGNLKRIR